MAFGVDGLHIPVVGTMEHFDTMGVRERLRGAADRETGNVSLSLAA